MPQARVQRDTAEQMIEPFVPVPILDLDAPVPQMVIQLVGVLKLFDKSSETVGCIALALWPYTSSNIAWLLRAALFTTGYVRLVGQEPAPSKCVHVSTSRVVMKDMKDWVLSREGDKWTVKFDVRDLGWHLLVFYPGSLIVYASCGLQSIGLCGLNVNRWLVFLWSSA